MWQRVNLNWNLRWCAQFPCRQNCHHFAFEKYWNCWWLLSVSRKTNMNSQFGIILRRCSNLFMMCTRSRQLCQQDYQSSYRCAHFRKMYAEEGGGGCNQQLCAITFFSPTPLALLRSDVRWPALCWRVWTSRFKIFLNESLSWWPNEHLGGIFINEGVMMSHPAILFICRPCLAEKKRWKVIW